MAVRGLIQRFEQLAVCSPTASSTSDVPADRPTRAARSVLQLADIFEPGVSATILARRRRFLTDEEPSPAQLMPFDARMRVLPGLRLHRLLRQRRRRSSLNRRPEQPQDQHGRRRKRHSIRHGANWFYRPRVKLAVVRPRPSRLVFMLRGADRLEDVE